MRKRVTAEEIDRMIDEAQGSVRRRVHRELHEGGGSALFQRFINVLIPGSFVTPHLHPQPNRWEWFQIIHGAVVVLIFDRSGVVIDRIELTPTTITGVEIEPQAIHTIAALEPSALLELKPGPWDPATDKEFVSWAPREQEPLAAACEQWYRSASIGDRFDS